MIINLIINYIKCIKKNKEKIIIIFLVTLAISIFTSLNSLDKDIKNSVQNYYNKYEYMDINISSNIGFTNNDILLIKENKNIDKIKPVKTINGTTTIKSVNYNLKIMNLNEKENAVNKFTITRGRLPITINEGVVEDSFFYKNKLSIGSIITIVPENSRYLKAKKIRITGCVKDDYTKTNNVSNIYLSNHNFNISYYNDLYITLKKNDSFKYNSKYYISYVNDNKDKIINSLSPLLEERYKYTSESLKEEINNLQRNLDEIYSSRVPQDNVDSSIKIISQNIDYNKKELNKINNYEIKSITRNDADIFGEYVKETSSIKNIINTYSYPILIVISISVMLILTFIINNNKKEINLMLRYGYNNFQIILKYLLYNLYTVIISAIISLLCLSRLASAIFISRINATYKMPFYFPTINTSALIFASLFIFTILSIYIIIYYYFIKDKKASNLILIIIVLIATLFTNTYINIDYMFKNTINKQYYGIEKYDLIINTNGILNEESINNIYNDIDIFIPKSKYLLVPALNIELENKKVSLLSVSENEISNYYSIKNIKKNDVIITKKLAEELNIKAKDIIKIKDINNKVKVKYIINDYFNNYIIINNMDTSDFDNNFILVKFNNNKNKIETTRLCDNPNIYECKTKSDRINSANNIINCNRSINLICLIYLIIINFVVLYYIMVHNIYNNQKNIICLKKWGYSSYLINNIVKNKMFKNIIIGYVLATILSYPISIIISKTFTTNSYVLDNKINISLFMLSVFINLIMYIICYILSTIKIKNIK